MSDLAKPADQFGLIGNSWPIESESAYHTAKVAADDSAACASTQSQSSSDAEERMSDEHGKTAGAVSDGYRAAAMRLREQAINYSTLSAWMADAAGKVRSAKTDIASLVRSGTSEIRDALDSETKGTSVSPSSTELTDKYRGEIVSVAITLSNELDGIGHSLHGDPGASRTPSYTSVSTTPEHADPHASMASYTGTPGAPAPEPHQLPEMPRATPAPTTESASAPSAPSVPAAPHPTLSNLIGGQGTPSAASPGGTASPHTPSQGTPSPPSPQAHQAPEEHQQTKHTGALGIPAVPLPNIPAAAESIATVVTSAAAHQLPTAPSTITPSVPVSTGFTPGVPGTAPVTPVTPGGLSPIGGGGLSSPPVTQPVTPAPQATPAPSPAAPQQTPPRSPTADLSWIQQRYGLAPGIEAPKSETVSLPALFITELPEPEAYLHRVLGALRQQFEQSGWAQPLAVASIRRGFETRCVYVTADGVSIHPQGVSLPIGVTPLDEIPTAPACSELSGSIMVTEKLKALVPSGWEVQSMLSTVPSDEQHQSTEQYQELSEAGELLPCGVSRGREGVEAGEAMSVFARVAIGSGGCGELDVESARLRATRWVGTQPVEYLAVLSRWYLSDAAASMSDGRWGEGVYASEKYLGLVEPKSQVA